jgi:glycosyltransferase involved in cell wall biosynthesis
MAKKLNSITVIIIAKNESARIGKCCQSVSWADEIILVDHNSTDETVSIARKFQAKIISVTAGNFSDLRNIGRLHSESEWMLYVDADELVSPALKDEIISLIDTKNTEIKSNAYKIRRVNYYYGNHLWPAEDLLERLFQKQGLDCWYGEVHESAKTVGPVGELNNPILHYTHRNLSEMISKTNEWSELEAKLRYNAGHPQIVWWRFIRVMVSGFLDSYIKQKGYQVGVVGWIESIYQAFSMYITYAKLWELQQSKKYE